jgi:hypothetical protein
MYTEQAYIEGFFKRAAFYGLHQKEALELLKESASSPAWQRSEGKNPEGGLNAKGRASYKSETGGTLKAPVTESKPKGERAKRQNSFCSRMCGMKRVNTGSKAQSDPDSRINKSLRKWNCKCGECNTTNDENIEMLKKATTISATKALLRQLRSMGVGVHRTAANFSKNSLAPINALAKNENMPGITYNQLAKNVGQSGPFYSPEANGIYLPRAKNLPKAHHAQFPVNSAMNEHGAKAQAGSMFSRKPTIWQRLKTKIPNTLKKLNIQNNALEPERPSSVIPYSPRNTFFHEAGHAMHHVEDQRMLQIVREHEKNPWGVFARDPNATLATERIANNNAINFMRQHNVPTTNIENYAKGTDQAYGTYARHFDPKFKTTNNVYAPGHSVVTHPKSPMNFSMSPE